VYISRRARRKRLVGSCCHTKHGSHIEHRNDTTNLVIICISRKVKQSTGSEESTYCTRSRLLELNFFSKFSSGKSSQYDADFRLNTYLYNKTPKTYEPLTPLPYPKILKIPSTQKDSKRTWGGGVGCGVGILEVTASQNS
jgi:hypothetical protein